VSTAILNFIGSQWSFCNFLHITYSNNLFHCKWTELSFICSRISLYISMLVLLWTYIILLQFISWCTFQFLLHHVCILLYFSVLYCMIICITQNKSNTYSNVDIAVKRIQDIIKLCINEKNTRHKYKIL